MASGAMKDPKDSKPEDLRPRSTEIFERGKKTLVGGVDSPVRAFRAVGGTPLVIDHAKGGRLYDVDGREYIDFVCSWGALNPGMRIRTLSPLFPIKLHAAPASA